MTLSLFFFYIYSIWLVISLFITSFNEFWVFVGFCLLYMYYNPSQHINQTSKTLPQLKRRLCIVWLLSIIHVTIIHTISITVLYNTRQTLVWIMLKCLIVIRTVFYFFVKTSFLFRFYFFRCIRIGTQDHESCRK